ncbi:MAG: helix-turn-helix transcriptional regulator [Acidobacteriota bacterium]
MNVAGILLVDAAWGGTPMPLVWKVLLLVAIVVIVAGTGAAIWLHARHRRQVASLLDRLERLEEGPGGGISAEQRRPPAGEIDHEPPAEEPANLSRDVLAGRTTHVQRLLGGAVPGSRTLADQAIVRIHRHIGESLTPHQLAHELCVSLRTLERGLALTLECTPRQLILALRMREARRLLREGARVGEAAELVGFANPFHFSRRFKEFFHVPPSEVRAEGRR